MPLRICAFGVLASMAAMQGRYGDADAMLANGRAAIEESGEKVWLFSLQCGYVNFWRRDLAGCGGGSARGVRGARAHWRRSALQRGGQPPRRRLQRAAAIRGGGAPDARMRGRDAAERRLLADALALRAGQGACAPGRARARSGARTRGGGADLGQRLSLPAGRGDGRPGGGALRRGTRAGGPRGGQRKQSGCTS